MQVPQNPAVYGPQRSSGPWKTCFAHDPARRAAGRDEPVGGGNGRARRASCSSGSRSGAPKNLGTSAQLDSSGPVQFAGYRYDSYTPAEAQVAVVFRGPEGKLLAVVTSMVWRDGDWKYLFPADGTPAMQVIADLTGYVPWSSF